MTEAEADILISIAHRIVAERAEISGVYYAGHNAYYSPFLVLATADTGRIMSALQKADAIANTIRSKISKTNSDAQILFQWTTIAAARIAERRKHWYRLA